MATQRRIAEKRAAFLAANGRDLDDVSEAITGSAPSGERRRVGRAGDGDGDGLAATAVEEGSGDVDGAAGDEDDTIGPDGLTQVGSF